MFQGIVPLLQNIAMIKVAVEINHYPELKRKILCASESDYDVSKEDKFYWRQQWKKIVEEKATEIMIDISIPKRLQRKVMNIAFQIGMKMLNWALYHEEMLGLSREISFKVLNSSFFTPQGIMDNKKAAEEFIKEESLSIKQKYDLACLYCLTDHIFHLSKKMTRAENESFYYIHRTIREPNIVLFWNYSINGKVEELTGDNDLNVYRLLTAVECGSKAAVQYFFDIGNFTRERDIVDAALQAVKKYVIIEEYQVWDILIRRHCGQMNWAPKDSYLEVIFFLLSNMTENTRKEFLKKDIEDDRYKLSRVLECFLNLSYQDYFMKTVEFMWDILPARSYAFLLLKICYKIHPTKKKFQESNFISKVLRRLCLYDFDEYEGDFDTYDYRGLLQEFWIQSPEHFKKYIFLTREECNPNDESEIHSRFGHFNLGAEILLHLLTVKHFTYDDKKAILLILNDVPDAEKQNICKITCIHLINNRMWEILNWFLQKCFSTNFRKAFKKALSFTKEAQQICINFTMSKKWDDAESFIKFSSLSDNEIAQLKKEMIYSEQGQKAYENLMTWPNREDDDSFLRWYCLSVDEIKEFKKKFKRDDLNFFKSSRKLKFR